MTKLKPGPYRATVCGSTGEYVWIDRLGAGTDVSGVVWNPCYITDAAQLVVLDLDPHTSAHIVDAIRIAGFRSLAAQIEAQTKPARIPEPRHVGACVNAASGKEPDVAEVMPWTRFSTLLLANWIDNAGRKRKWDDLIDPALIREGVTNNE